MPWNPKPRSLEIFTGAAAEQSHLQSGGRANETPRGQKGVMVIITYVYIILYYIILVLLLLLSLFIYIYINFLLQGRVLVDLDESLRKEREL